LQQFFCAEKQNSLSIKGQWGFTGGFQQSYPQLLWVASNL
jgi:hypothetical protein